MKESTLRVTKFNYHDILNRAAEIVGKNPAITDREVCELLCITRLQLNKIKSDREYYERMEAVFTKNITKDLLLVDVAMIQEAQSGNVQAARYLAERHGKFVKKFQIEVKSPYELFAKEMTNKEEAELAEFEEEKIEVTKDQLPERDKRNDKPLTRAKEERKQLDKRLKRLKHEKTPQYKHNRADRYQLRKRAKAVNLDPLPTGRTTKTKRDEWLQKLYKLEQEHRENSTDNL